MGDAALIITLVLLAAVLLPAPVVVCLVIAVCAIPPDGTGAILPSAVRPNC